MLLKLSVLFNPHNNPLKQRVASLYQCMNLLRQREEEYSSKSIVSTGADISEGTLLAKVLLIQTVPYNPCKQYPPRVVQLSISFAMSGATFCLVFRPHLVVLKLYFWFDT